MLPKPFDNSLAAAQRQFLCGGRFGWHEARDGFAAIGDDDFLASLSAFDELREPIFRFENIDLHISHPQLGQENMGNLARLSIGGRTGTGAATPF